MLRHHRGPFDRGVLLVSEFFCWSVGKQDLTARFVRFFVWMSELRSNREREKERERDGELEKKGQG